VNELGRRVIVALIGAPLAIAAIWYGDAALAFMASALAAVGAWEFYRIAREGGSTPLVSLGVLLSALVPLATHAHFLGVLRIPLVAITLTVLAVMAATIWLRGVSGKPLSAAATTILGVAYTGGTLSYVYALRYFNYAVGDTAGALVVILPVLLTWASDTGAYFAGRTIGGPKLMPSVSPGKTISGAVGGIVLTVIVLAIFVHYLLRPYASLAFSPGGLLLFGIGISVAAQVGDLAESLFKREAGVKDSGTLFPGHGGVLDRLDSMFFVLPVAYALYGWLLIAAPA
jgi:phosphatidate cytidylyltransferase